MSMEKKIKKVMIFGTFDIFHKGHENFFKQAKKYGEYLIVVVARDRTVLSVKKKKTLNSEGKRVVILRDSELTDEVILGNLGDKYEIIKKYQPDVICLGYDQKVFVRELRKKIKKFKLDKTRIIRLKSYYPEKYKTSLLKNYARR